MLIAWLGCAHLALKQLKCVCSALSSLKPTQSWSFCWRRKCFEPGIAAYGYITFLVGLHLENEYLSNLNTDQNTKNTTDNKGPKCGQLGISV